MSIEGKTCNEGQKPSEVSGRILVVDDDQLVNKTLTRYLEKVGHKVISAFNGAEAAEKLEHDGNFDLVLTDLKMPGVGGKELLSIMSEKFNHIPRIVLTAVGSDEDILHALKTGAYDFLSKPIVDFNILNYSIKRAIEKKHLQEDRTKALMQLEKMYEVISMLNLGSDTEEIFERIEFSLKPIIPFNRISLFSVDDKSSTITLRMSHSETQMLIPVGHVFNLSKNELNYISNEREIVLIRNIGEFVETRDLPEDVRLFLDEGFCSAVIMPILIEKNVKGHLVFASDIIDAYHEDHIRFLRLIAAQLALSIQRGELITQLEVHSKHLEHLVKVRTHELLKTQKTTIFALSKLAEARDNETGAHLERIRNYCVLLSQLLKYSGEFDLITNEFLRNMYDSSILHDIGKVGIPDMVLLKPGPLSFEEYEVMKTHTTVGFKALEDASRELGENSFLDMAKDIALYHHERWDGQGYPMALKGEEIPLCGRIVTIADIYDALTSVRPYKEAFSHEEAIRIIQDESYRFDPRIIKLFIENNEDFNRIRQQFT